MVAGEHNGLIPITSTALKKPCILRRKRRRSEQENLHPKLMLPSPKISFTPEADSKPSPEIPNLLTPLKTPVKNLPFSPSRVSGSTGL